MSVDDVWDRAERMQEQHEADLHARIAELEAEDRVVIEAVRELCDRFGAEDLDELGSLIVEKSWSGLLTILDDIYPASIFGGADDDWQDQTRDLGPRLVTLGRHLDAERIRAKQAEAERDKWEWVARDACRELAYETHVNPQSPLDYRLANWRPRGD